MSKIPYKWSADDLIILIVVKRLNSKQHPYTDKEYDYPDVHEFVEHACYIAHIKRRHRRGELVVDDCPIPGETRFPAGVGLWNTRWSGSLHDAACVSAGARKL